MGIIRGGVITILAALLLITFFTGNIFSTLSGSLEYNQLKPSLVNISKDVIKEYNIFNQLEQNKIYTQAYCLQHEKIYFNESELNLEFPCSVFLSGEDSIIEYAVNQLVDQLYYKQYNCKFWQCVKEQNPPLVLISEKSYQYWRALFYWSIILSVVLFLLIFLIAKDKSTPFIISGILIILTAIPFKSLNWIFNLIPMGDIAKFLSIFFTRAQSVFSTRLTLGIILLVLGLVLKISGLGKKMSWNYKKEENKQEEKEKDKKEETKKEQIETEKISKTELRKIVDEEIDKSKQTKKKKKIIIL